MIITRPLIRRHINSLPPQQIFTTREMLIYGKRSAVDSALRSMVNTNQIFRLARGVFVTDMSIEPTIEEIVKAKLNAYRSNLSTSAESDLYDLSLVPWGEPNTFAKNGSSSSFWTIKGRAYLQNVCERKMALCKSVVAHFIYALWFLRNSNLLTHAVGVVGKKFGRAEREVAWLASALMPAWLRESMSPVFPRPKVRVDNPFQSMLT